MRLYDADFHIKPMNDPPNHHSETSLSRKFLSRLMDEKTGQKVFYSIVIAHFVIYWVIGMVIYPIYYLNTEGYNVFGVDFVLGAKLYEQFLANPANIYQVTDPSPFLNLPSFMLYVIAWCWPISLVMDLYSPVFLMIYALAGVLKNLLSCYIIFKIMKTKKIQKLLGKSIFSNPFIIMSIYMATPIHYLEYLIGQHDHMVGLCFLIGIYFLMKDKDHYAMLFWSIAIIFKLTIIFFIIFFIFRDFKKKIFKNLSYALIPQIPTIVMVLIWPNYITDFLNTNIIRLDTYVSFFYQGNFASLLFENFNIPLIISTIVLATLLLPSQVYLITEQKNKMNEIEKLILIVLIYINILPVHIATHSISFLGIVGIWFAINNRNLNQNIKYIKILLAIPFLSIISWMFFPYFSLLVF